MKPNRQIDEEPRTHQVQLRVTPTQKGLWVKAARDRGMKLSEWICEHLDRASEAEQRQG